MVCGGVVMAMPQRGSWQHAKAVGSCAAMTEDGKKCTRKTEPGQKYCWQHAKSKPEAKKPAAK